MSSADPAMNISTGVYDWCSVGHFSSGGVLLIDSMVVSVDITSEARAGGVCLPAPALLRAAATLSVGSFGLWPGDFLSGAICLSEGGYTGPATASKSSMYHVVALCRLLVSNKTGTSTGTDLSDGAGLPEYGMSGTLNCSDKAILEVSLAVSSKSHESSTFPKKTESWPGVLESSCKSSMALGLILRSGTDILLLYFRGVFFFFPRPFFPIFRFNLALSRRLGQTFFFCSIVIADETALQLK